VVMEWYGGWVPLGQPVAVITFLSIMQLHDVVVRYRLRMLALGAPFLCAQHPARIRTGRGVDFTPFDRPLPLTIRLVVDARRLALAHGVVLAGPVVIYDLCFQGSTYDQHTISYEADGRVSQAVEAPVQAVGGVEPD
jgi:hypothetical protein